MKTEICDRSKQTPEGLAGQRSWLPWLTDEAKRLVAARAYLMHPDQRNSREGRGARYEAAVLALGYRPEVAALFREGPFTPEEAEAVLVRRGEQKTQEEKRARERAEEEAKEEKYWSSARGKRRARQLEQKIFELYYPNDKFTRLVVTKKVLTAIRKTPTAQCWLVFDSGTLGEPYQNEGERIFQSVKAARKTIAQRLLKLHKDGNHGLGGISGMRFAGWKRIPEELPAGTVGKIDKFFNERILPWALRQVKER